MPRRHFPTGCQPPPRRNRSRRARAQSGASFVQIERTCETRRDYRGSILNVAQIFPESAGITPALADENSARFCRKAEFVARQRRKGTEIGQARARGKQAPSGRFGRGVARLSGCANSRLKFPQTRPGLHTPTSVEKSVIFRRFRFIFRLWGLKQGTSSAHMEGLSLSVAPQEPAQASHTAFVQWVISRESAARFALVVRSPTPQKLRWRVPAIIHNPIIQNFRRALPGLSPS